MANFRKNSLEQYYTLPQLAVECTQFMISKIGRDHDWVEPTAGRGSFLDALEECNIRHYSAFDIDPKDDRITKANFLEVSLKGFDNVFIGNPPFGRACSLAIKIFNHCAEFAKFIGFIVPKSFNKLSIQDQLNLNFHKESSTPCPPVSFEDSDGVPYGGGHLNTEFQIWACRPETSRDLRGHYRSSHFKFVSKNDDYDLPFRTHGYGARSRLTAR